MTPANRWHEVWGRKGATEVGGSDETTLRDLMAADGFNTGFGDITPEAWTEFVHEICTMFRIRDSDTLFEVGCGAGAFLLPPYRAGVHVGGADYSPSLLECARVAMPDGTFQEIDAAAIPVTPQADLVFAHSVFLYFDGLDYARTVITRMCRKARRGVAILDMPDAGTAAEALARRQEAFGSATAYQTRYQGLEHQSYERGWIEDALTAEGLVDIQVESQSVPGYANAAYRFNAWGWVPGAQGMEETA